MTIQEQCANKVYELLPELKELSFGCKILNKHLNKTFVICTSSNISKDVCLNGFYEEEQSTWIWKKYLNDDDTYKIIGHPIRLADILIAISKIHEDKTIIVKHYSDCWALIVGDKESGYNLSKDNLLDQSDEFCTFLLEMIK